MCKLESTYKKQLNEAKEMNPKLTWKLRKGKKHYLAKLINTESYRFRSISLPSTKGSENYGRFSAKLINEGLVDLGMTKLKLKHEMSISFSGLSHSWNHEA